MALFSNNILPPYSEWVCDWYPEIDESGALSGFTTFEAHYTFDVNDFKTETFALITCQGATGLWHFIVSYTDSDTNKMVRISAQLRDEAYRLPISLYQGTTNSITFYVKCVEPGAVQPITLQLIEQPVRAVDLEYSAGTSKVNAPKENWEAEFPGWQTNRYIWQRVATTFLDDHIEYSTAEMIQVVDNDVITSVVEEYYLSDSETEQVGGSWSTERPTWFTGKFIWSRSKVFWSVHTPTYSRAILSKVLNKADEKIKEDIQEVKEKQEELATPDGIFNTLTDNGKREGIYISDSKYYFNASHIRSGILEVADASKTIFKADLSSKSIYLAGFTATDNSLRYYRKGLYDVSPGTYVGTDGVSTAILHEVGYGSGTWLGWIAMSTDAIFGGLTRIESDDTYVEQEGFISFSGNPIYGPIGNWYGARSRIRLNTDVLIIDTNEISVSDSQGSDFRNEYKATSGSFTLKNGDGANVVLKFEKGLLVV